jgi:hypothetical protein
MDDIVAELSGFGHGDPTDPREMASPHFNDFDV